MSGVVHVVGRFPPPADGQTLATERCALFLDEAFHVRRHDTRPPGADPLSAEPRFSARRAAHFLRLRPRLRRALAEAPAAPVVWHSISPAPLGHARDRLATVPAFAPGQPVAAVLHRATFDALWAGRARRSVERLVERVSTFVFQSEALAERCAAFVPADKRTVIPNTVRDDAAASDAEVEARRRGRPDRPFHVLFLSNLLPEKGYADVLRAVGRLAADGRDVTATFAGRWPSDAARAAFDAEAAALGVADRVAVPGAISDAAEVRRLHLAADAFALPTVHPTETQPIAILEALAAGTPVVTVDRPITRDMLTDGLEGALVPPHAPEAIAGALLGLMAPERWRAASEAARSRFEAQFAPAVVGELWRGLARELQPG